MRRGVGSVTERRETCHECGRTPLVGERVHLFRGAQMLCELCKAMRGEEPESSRLVHGPAFGHAVRITDQRESRRAAVTPGESE